MRRTVALIAPGSAGDSGKVRGPGCTVSSTSFTRMSLLLCRLLTAGAAGLVTVGLLSVAPAAAATASGWSVIPSRNAKAPQDELFGVSCATARACTAVGGTRGDLGGKTLAERWNGRRWTRKRSTPRGFLLGVSCTSASG